jgi:elongation factor Tu
MAQVDYETSGKYYSHFDCVNHIDHVKNLIDSPAPISGAILVVSSVDGVMFQTEEQVRLARKVNVPIWAVFLNKIDLVKDEELVELNEMEIKALLSSYGFDKNNTPIIAGSAQKALEYQGNNLNYNYWQPILQLTMKLTSRVVQPQQEGEQPFLMAIEDVFNIEGKGVVVTGTIKRGNLAIGNPLEIVGLRSPISTTCVGTIEDINSILLEGKKENEVPKVASPLSKGVRGLFSEEQQIRTGFLLKNVEEKYIERGQVLAAPKSIAAHTNFEAEVYHLAVEEGGKHAPLVFNDRVQFDFWTADITGKVSLSGIIPPGQNGSITVDLEKPVAMKKGTRFVMKKDDGKMGVGVVTALL